MAKKAAAVVENGSQKKRVCPVSREQFASSAKPLPITINGVPMTAMTKEFSTGSFGWYLTGKIPVSVGDTSVDIQIGLNLTCVGSKELPK